jgi:putative thioredoxin
MNPLAPPAQDPGPLSFDVSEADFQHSVLQRSLDVPVLLDCWAPWCGPCRGLTPVLEKLAQAYAGQFVLAKLNIDEAPQIAAALQARSIPLVVLFVGGRPVDQFAGALPEGQVRAFLDRHLSAPLAPAEALRQEAAEAADPALAEQILHEALEHDAGNVAVKLDLAARMLDRGALDDGAALLDSIDASQRDERHAALMARIALASNRPQGDPKALAARIQADPKDFDARFALAAVRAWEGDFNAAFDQLLEVVLRDKAEAREKARLQLIDWFKACPDAEAVSKGRRYLAMYLN